MQQFNTTKKAKLEFWGSSFSSKSTQIPSRNGFPGFEPLKMEMKERADSSKSLRTTSGCLSRVDTVL